MRTLVIFLLPNLVISLQTTFHGYFYVLWKQGLCDRSLNLSPPEHLAELSQLVQTYRRAAVLDVTESVISCRSMYLCRGERSQNIPRRMKHSIILLLHVTEHTEVFQKWSYPQNLKLCVQTRHTIDNVFLYTSSKEKTGFVERPELGMFWYSSQKTADNLGWLFVCWQFILH